jgi:type II secretory pathway component PulM
MRGGIAVKTLNRELTNREKLLLIILIVIILGALYYLFIFQPTEDRISAANITKANLEDELLIADANASKITGMKEEMADIENNGHILSSMPSYNAGKQEIDFLNDTLSNNTTDYYVGFTQMTRMGNQIRRNFTLTFTADNYKTAKSIIDALENCEIRCLIGDMVVVPSNDEDDLLSGPVDVNCVATFYETMYGGQEDSDLPEDSAPKDGANTAQ